MINWRFYCVYRDNFLVCIFCFAYALFCLSDVLCLALLSHVQLDYHCVYRDDISSAYALLFARRRIFRSVVTSLFGILLCLSRLYFVLLLPFAV